MSEQQRLPGELCDVMLNVFDLCRIRSAKISGSDNYYAFG